MSKFRAAGYDAPFVDLTEGVTDYVQQYVDQEFAVY